MKHSLKNIASEFIQTVEVDGHDRAMVSWETDDARFHIWLACHADGRTKIPVEVERGTGSTHPTIYKNALVKRGDPGHFECKYLSASNQINSEIIWQVLAAVDLNAARNAHKQKHDEANAALLAKHEASLLAERLTKAAPTMFDCLKKIELRLNAVGGPTVSEIRDCAAIAELGIAFAEGKLDQAVVP